MAATTAEIKAALEAIATASDGVLKPDAVVLAAVAPDHPLHDRFEWDDTKAGHAYRLDQARALIRAVKVEFTVEKRTIRSVAYVQDPDSKTRDGGYTPVTRGMTDRELAAAIVAQEFGRALASLERARKIAAVLSMEAPIEDMATRLRELAKAVPALKVA